jgi:hypothetical protein
MARRLAALMIIMIIGCCTVTLALARAACMLLPSAQ